MEAGIKHEIRKNSLKNSKISIKEDKDVITGDPYEIHIPPKPNHNPDSRGLGAVLFECMTKYEKRVCQTYAQTGETQTYSDVKYRSICVALNLKSRGLQSGDLVGLCTYNHLDAVLPLLASLFLSAGFTAYDASLSTLEIIHLLKLTRPKFIFAEPKAVPLLEDGLRGAGIHAEIVVFGDGGKYVSFKEFLVAGNKEVDNFKVAKLENDRKTAFVSFSSGTTGLPKGIDLSYRTTLAQMQAVASTKGLNYQVNLLFTPLYWVSCIMFLMASILSGGNRVISSCGFQEELFLKFVNKYKVTISFTSPSNALILSKASHLFKKYDTSSLEYFAVGGGPCSKELILELRKLLPRTKLVNGYGMTEVCRYITHFDLEKDMHLYMSKPGSVGKPLSGYSYKILDPISGKTLGPNETGELRYKCLYMMSGYYNQPEESKIAWDENGWLKTGDIAYYDEDRCFYIVDRSKELILYKSWHVIPSELEALLSTHPGVKEVAVVGVPHEIDGEHPVAVVIPMPGSDGTENDIIEYVKARISENKWLHGGVKFVSNIPKTVSGKILRRHIRNMILKNQTF